MKKKRILILGATGMIGKKLANSFISNNFEVNILTRNIVKARKKIGDNYNFFEGDVLQPDSLTDCFNEINGIYLHLNDFNEDTLHKTFTEGTKNIIELAKHHKINRIIFQSSSIVSPENKGFPSVEALLEAEELIKSSNLDYTILKPGYFMEALKFFLRGNQVSVIGEGKNPYYWVSGNEFTERAIEIFNHNTYFEKTIYIFGPEALILEEALKKYCSIQKPNAKFDKLSHDMMRAISRFSNNKEMSYMADFIKFMDYSTDNYSITKKNPNYIILNSTIEKWIEANA